MQSLQGVTAAQFKASVQTPKAKFEIYYGGAWVDLTALWGKNYLKSWSISLGGATMTPAPVSGTWSAVIDDPDGIFYPANSYGAYKDYFTTGRKVRISVGGTYGGVDVFWKRLTGVMDSPKFAAVIGGDVQLQGMDYNQYLADFKMKSPNNYWGTSVTKSTVVSGGDSIRGMAVYNDKIYVGMQTSGKLYEWNGVSAWGGRAPALGVGEILSLAVYSNKLYGGTSLNGKLYEWNGTNAWVEKAPQLGAETAINSLAVHNNKLYGGTSANGKLYEWNDVNAWVEKAPQLGAETDIFSLAVYNGKLYGGTSYNGKLYEWNGTNAWVEKAPRLSNTVINSLAVHNNKLYGGTSPNGKLYEWNDVNAWVEKAPQLGAETAIHSLAVCNNKLYGGTSANGKLYEWNDVNAWVEKAPKLGAETYILSLAVCNNKLYGGTGPSGKLYEWNDVNAWVEKAGISPFHYAMPADCNGVYSAYWNGSSIYNGADWLYDSVTNEFVFNFDKTIAAGTNNLILYYFQTQIPENVVADILVSAGLYATRAAALAAMTYTATGITIDRVSFPSGNSALYSISQISERCNYRFHFNYDAVPAFIPAPAIKDSGLEDFALEQNHIAGPSYYEDASELYNYIDIKGEEKAQPIGIEQTEKSNYAGSDSDAASIAAYGERTKTMMEGSNHLFQSDAVCAAMATELLALYKDPNKYFSFNAEFFAVPLEKGDTIRTQVRLSAADGLGKKWGTFKWSDGTKWGGNGIVLVHRGIIRDIKINNFGTTYKLELA